MSSYTGPSLPHPWLPEQDMLLVYLYHVRDQTLAQIGRRIKLVFPQFRACTIPESALDRRLQILELREVDYFREDFGRFWWSGEGEGKEEVVGAQEGRGRRAGIGEAR